MNITYKTSGVCGFEDVKFGHAAAFGGGRARVVFAWASTRAARERNVSKGRRI